MKLAIIKMKVDSCDFCPFGARYWFMPHQFKNKKCKMGVDFSSVPHGEIAEACPLEEYPEESK